MVLLIFHPLIWGALISHNNLFPLNGGIGSPLPAYYFDSSSIPRWRLVPNEKRGHHIDFSPSSTPPQPEAKKWSLTFVLNISQSGAESAILLISLAELFMWTKLTSSCQDPSPLKFEETTTAKIPLAEILGISVKLSLNPTLIKQDGKLFAAEADGTVITYTHNPKSFPVGGPTRGESGLM